MKVLFSLYDVILLFSTANALKCMYSDRLFTIPSNEFTMEGIEQKINSLELRDQYKTCCLTIAIDYRQQMIHIGFGHENNQVTLSTNKEISVSTAIVLVDEDIIQDPVLMVNALTFKCDENDGCDRKFLFDHLGWLLRVNYTNLESSIRELLVVENSTSGDSTAFSCNNISTTVCFLGHCFTDVDSSSNIIRCLSSVCYLYYDMRENTSIKHCEEPFQASVGVSLTVLIRMSKEGENLEITPLFETIGYWCQTDLCNNDHVGQQIQQAVLKYYNLSMMFEVLQNDFDQSATTSTLIYTSPYTTSKQLQNHAISSIILIFSVLTVVVST